MSSKKIHFSTRFSDIGVDSGGYDLLVVVAGDVDALIKIYHTTLMHFSSILAPFKSW